MKTVTVPKAEAVEVSLYQGWINQNFNNDCIDGAGIMNLNFDSDGNCDTGTVVPPLGDTIAAALNTAMDKTSIPSLKNLNVVKKSARMLPAPASKL
jgi:hypothetical protein